MCGFLGEIATQLLEKESFQKLLDLSSKRGPDQQGFWRDYNCQLGFNRLSILDLSENGKQPLISPSGKFAMVFNGEIYNYKDIQKKYNIADTDLRSGSDTEILSHLIEKISIPEFAKELNGMFAIAAYNIETKELHLIRDFAGIKPLFYGIHEQGIVFASQFDQIFHHPGFAHKKLRPEIIKEYFGLGYMQAPNTVFENIFQVEPSQIVTWNFEKRAIASKTQYYEWKVTNDIKETSFEAVEKLETIFSKVIQSQLNADVPVATFLSGGIDSPLVAAIAKQYKKDIKSFTFGINDKQYNESDVAQKIANELHLDHEIENSTESEILSNINLHFKGLTEPFGDYSSLPTYLITKKAKEHATVMLSGDGGDEMFWGYPRFLKSINHLYWFKIPLFLRKIIVPIYRKINKETSSAMDIFNSFDQWILYKQLVFNKLDNLVPNTSFSKELVAVYAFNKNLNKQNALRYLKKNEFFAHLQMVLRKVDLMSMSNSLEVRVPFLDKEVIEFSNSILPEYGVNHKISKIILRKLLNKFVDKSITSLPKKGFAVPLEKWLKNELKQDVINSVVNKPLYGKEFVDTNFLRLLVTDFYNNKNRNWQIVWHIYAWQKWAETNNLAIKTA
jgi:asparagine synthase (glutamine-hydrolysing)